MHVHADPVTGAVHVELHVGFFFNHLIEAAFEQAEIEHALRQHADRDLVILVEWIARFEHIHAGQLRIKHSLIHVALRAGEFAAHWEGARDVAGVAFVFATGVNQQQIAVLHLAIAVVVVQHAGVRAAGDDVVVRGRARAVADELVREFGLNVIFMLAGPGSAHCAGVGHR